ncbi:MAG: porphobilinogen synthase, partial [Actinomycetota bacterium]|nr:porphobilinogen synthase [Actinomycetota bacterium]
EYAMVELAAAAGAIDRDRAIIESLVGIRRTGADAILTYWALEVGRSLRDGHNAGGAR